MPIVLLLTACANVPGEGQQATTEPSAVAQPAAAFPVGVDWVSYFVDGVAVLSAPRPTLRFDSQEQLRGNGGCNQFTGKMNLGTQTLMFNGLASTRMACMPVPSGQEDKFFKAIELTRGWKMQDDELVLLADNGRELIRLARVRP